jgi:hypothetical protein
MRASAVFLALTLVCLGASGLAAQEQDTAQAATKLAVASAVVTSAVVDRQPSDTLTAVAADAGTVYCWTRITGAAGEVQISHVWYRGDAEVARIPLRIAGSNWRTWSSKKFIPEWTGAWRVEIVAPDGTVLETVSFTVG